jgi:multidrug resistance efflux pump
MASAQPNWDPGPPACPVISAEPGAAPAAVPCRSRWGKVLRRVLGLGLLGLPVWVVLPNLWSMTSTQAIVNARLITLTAPIAGVVATPLPPSGQVVKSGTVLLTIAGGGVDRGRLEELKTEAASLQERLAALTHHRAGLAKLKDQLTANVRDYQQAITQRIEHELAEAKAEAAATAEVLRQRAYEESQDQTLHARGIRSLRELNQARSAAEVARENHARATAAVARLQAQLDAMRQGTFTGPGDSRNDVPYSQQRIHEIMVQELDDEAKIREGTVRLAQLQRQIAVETEHIARWSRDQIKAPVDGTIWRPLVAPGSVVGPGTELLQLIDHASLFVDALVSEKALRRIHVGDRARVRLIGSTAEVSGTVRSIFGGALRDDPTLAAVPPTAGRGAAHVLIDLDRPARADSEFQRPPIGRRVEVRFGDEGRPQSRSRSRGPRS